MDRMARGQKFVLRSGASYGRRPKVWHTELMLQVTWWRSTILAKPAHSRQVTAPERVPDMIQPMAKGSANVDTTNAGNRRLMVAKSRSATRSGANRAYEVGS